VKEGKGRDRKKEMKKIKKQMHGEGKKYRERKK
jgi:hypothetical protein